MNFLEADAMLKRLQRDYPRKEWKLRRRHVSSAPESMDRAWVGRYDSSGSEIEHFSLGSNNE